MSPSPRPRSALGRALPAAALAGVAIGMGGAPFEAYAIAWFGPALLALALRLLADEPASVRARRGPRRELLLAASLGLVTGVTANATTCAWVVDLLVDYGSMPLPLALLLALLLFVAQGLPFAFAALSAWLVHRAIEGGVGRDAPSVELALVPSLVVAASAVPMIFPWRIGNSQTGLLAFAQAAELGGLPLLDLLLGVASVLALVAGLRRARWWRWAAVLALAALALPSLAGWARLEALRAARDEVSPLVVGIVQHDFDVPERARRELWEEQLAISWQLSRALDVPGLRILLWPESSFPWGLDRRTLGLDPQIPDAYPTELGMALRGFSARNADVPLVFGALTRDEVGIYNSVVAIDPTRVLGVVDKTRLMPFSERIPLYAWLPFLHGVLRPGFTPGPPRGGSIDVAGERLGILNCYEDLMPDHVRAVMGGEPTFLSNHTNDAWFGRTRAPGLHHFLARMRAIETRRDLVRTVNTGVSGIIASTGETLARTPIFERRTLLVEVRPSSEVTPWVRLGDLTTPACWAMLLGALLAALRRTRREGDARGSVRPRRALP